MPYGCNYKHLLSNFPVSQQAQEKHLDSFTAFSTNQNPVLVPVHSRFYFAVRKRFAFPRLVADERHCVTVYVCLRLRFPRNTSKRDYFLYERTLLDLDKCHEMQKKQNVCRLWEFLRSRISNRVTSVNSRGQQVCELEGRRRRRHHDSNGGAGVCTAVAPGFARLYWHPKTTGPARLCCQAGFIWMAITHEKTGNKFKAFLSTQTVI